MSTQSPTSLLSDQCSIPRLNSGALKRCVCVCVYTQSCLTLCDPVDCSPPGSSVHGILQARILEWVAISSSRGSSWPRDWTLVSYTGRQILYHLCHLEAHNWLQWSTPLLLLGRLFGEGIFPRVSHPQAILQERKLTQPLACPIWHIMFFTTFTFEILLPLHKSPNATRDEQACKTPSSQNPCCCTANQPPVDAHLSQAGGLLAALLQILARGRPNIYVLPNLPDFLRLLRPTLPCCVNLPTTNVCNSHMFWCWM